MPPKQDLLQLLKEHRSDYLSGEQICRGLGVSRTAVWKHMGTLRNMGYNIEAKPNAGYRLLTVPDRLYPEEVGPGLGVEVIGKEIKYATAVESTNETAKEWAREGAPDGAVFIAEEQGAGKGRLGRGWFSPRGEGIWFSVILRPQMDPAGVPRITLMAAVAVTAAVYKETGYLPGIKWPNDLLGTGGKLCGILTEMNADMERVNYVVIGMGLNVNILPAEIPEELQGTATSLAAETGKTVDRVQLLRAILRELDKKYRDCLRAGFGPVFDYWKKWNVTLGKTVRVAALKEVAEGTAEDIDQNGALMVRLESGEVKSFLAGEVTLRKNS